MFHVLPEHERAVISTLGRISGVKGPGTVFLVPLIQTMTRVDVRPIEARIRNAVATYRVADPVRALSAVASYRTAVETLLETAFGNTMRERGSDALTFEREGIREAIERAMRPACGEWGLVLDKVEVNR